MSPFLSGRWRDASSTTLPQRKFCLGELFFSLLKRYYKQHFNSYGHIIAVGDANMFTGILTPVLTQISFQSHRLLFSHASAEVRGKIHRKQISLNRIWNSQPPGDDSDTLTTEPPWRGPRYYKFTCILI